MRNSTNLNLTATSTHFSEVSSEKIFLPDESEFAVLKIDLNGKILYANQASFAALEDWLSCRKETIPGCFLKQHPDILNPEADFSKGGFRKAADLPVSSTPAQDRTVPA